MATSKVQLANLALQKLGQSRKLEALDQNSANARTLSLAYDAVRRRELRRYTWAFSITRDSIAADADYNKWGDWIAYSKPNDFLRLIRDDESGQVVDWKIEGDFILSMTASPLEIKYIADVDDPNKYDSLFFEAMACSLALQTCEEITQSTSRKANILDEYTTAIAEAKRCGAIEKEAQEFPEDEWLQQNR